MYLSELLFCDKRKFKRLNMALMIRQITLILCAFTPSHMNFQAILMPKEILAKFCHKKSTQFEYLFVNFK